jgi:hypothetical protein
MTQVQPQFQRSLLRIGSIAFIAGKGAYKNAVGSKKEFVKRRFLDLYDTQKDLASVTQKERDKFDKLALDIHAESDRNHF